MTYPRTSPDAPRRACAIALGAFAFGLLGVPARAHDVGPALTIPIQRATAQIRGGAKGPQVRLVGAWRGEAPAVDPFAELATLRIFGAFGGDSGTIPLDPARWSRRKNGWRYEDPNGAAGGIKRVDLVLRRKGGKLSIRGSGARWLYEAKDGAPASVLTATFLLGNHQWCAQFQKPRLRRAVLKAQTKKAPRVFDTTWQGVQAIFERNGCLTSGCHGGVGIQGNLDLQPAAAYGNLVDVVSELGGKFRVQRGSRQDSFLWEKLAAATAGYDLGGRGSPMPVGLPPLSPEELEAIRLWIQFGAPETGVVLGTEEVLGACVPPADPPNIDPPPPPPAGQGVQFHAPPWIIPPADGITRLNGEDEVCYATYFDVRDRIPDEFKTPCPEFWGGETETCYFFNRTELTQSPNSHHSIIHIYRGEYDLAWEPSPPGGTTGFRFRCHGGPSAGQICDPRVAGVCGEGSCHGEPVSSIACIGYGPPDYGRGFQPNAAASGDNAPSVGGSQQPFSRNAFASGVFGIFPARGVIVWNSHAFNLFADPATNEQWWNIYFAPPADRQFLMRGIFDATDIFVQNVPPFEEREYCRTVTFPAGMRIFEFSSHTHQRGRLFRIWGPGIAQSCRSTASNPGACAPEPDAAPFFITTEYNDPTVLNRNDNPWVLDDSNPAARRFKFCAKYDNGFANPLTVKRNSTSPVPPQFGNLAPGGKCRYASFGGTIVDNGIACLSGPRRGEACGGDDRMCDSRSGALDGLCDACPLTGGVTTDDEMFILLGSYYCAPGSDCEAGVCIGGPNRGQRCDNNGAQCPQSSCGPYTN